MLKSVFRYATENIIPSDREYMDEHGAIIHNCDIVDNQLVCEVGSGSKREFWQVYVPIPENLVIFCYGYTRYLCDPATKEKLEEAQRKSTDYYKNFCSESYNLLKDTFLNKEL